MKINIRDGISIDVRSDKSLYITIGNYTYYIDDSTGEQIMDFWKNNEQREISKNFPDEITGLWYTSKTN